MINKINKLSQSEFIKVFANIFENTEWIAKELYNKKPFNNFKELSSKCFVVIKIIYQLEMKLSFYYCDASAAMLKLVDRLG